MAESSLHFNDDGGLEADPSIMPEIRVMRIRGLLGRVGNAFAFLPANSEMCLSEHIRDATSGEESS